MTSFATLRTQIGIAKETIWGTPVAATAFIPVTKFDVEPKVAKLEDKGWRGSMGELYGMQNGPQWAEISVSGDCFADTVGYILSGLLGDVVTTGASAPFTHKMALLNTGDGQPKSFTLTDSQMGIQARQFAGCQFSEVTFKWDPSGLLTYDAKGTSVIGNTASAPTATYGTLTPVASWIGVLKFGAVAQTNIESAELSIKRSSIDPVITLGAADPYDIMVGGLEVTGKLTFVAKDEAPYTQMAANTTPGILVATFAQSANATVAFTMSQPYYDTAKITRGKSYAEIETTFKAVMNTTDVGASAGYSPMSVSVINSLPTGTFG